MKVGFTGTQAGMTARQKAELAFWLRAIRDAQSFSADSVELRHGGCVGGDEQFDALAVSIGFDDIHVFPASDVAASKRADIPRDASHTHHEPAPALERNRVSIVDPVDALVAAPRQRAEELRSGTWATIRYARKVGCTTITIWP